MLRSWLNPIFSTVPREIRLSGMFPMALYAAINPMSIVKSPYYGIFTFMIMWWVFYQRNPWNVIKNPGDTWQNDKWYWFIKAAMWSFFTQWMLLFVVYVLVLMLVKISVMPLRLNS